MKIFGWMHRKFNQKVDYCMVSRKKEDAFGEDEKEAKKITGEGDTEALLLHDHVTLVDVLDGWPDGILTIGTFGLDPFHHKKGYSFVPEEYSVGGKSEDYEEEEELNRIAIHDFKHQLQKIIASRDHIAKNEISKPTMIVISDDQYRRFPQFPESEECKEEKQQENKGARTTLADLFSADASPSSTVLATSDKSKTGNITPDSDKKQAFRKKKHVQSLAKKLVPWKGDDSRPTTKLYRLMTKILKRKIHPDLERQIHRDVNSTHPPEIPLVLGKSGSACLSGGNQLGNESISLLPGPALEL